VVKTKIYQGKERVKKMNAIKVHQGCSLDGHHQTK